jgi:sec-independent protein translocase protein TatA
MHVYSYSIYLCSYINYKFASAINYSIMGRFGVTEILVILAVVLLLLEVKKFRWKLGNGIKKNSKEDQPADKRWY